MCQSFQATLIRFFITLSYQESIPYLDTTISENNFENKACKIYLQFMLPEKIFSLRTRTQTAVSPSGTIKSNTSIDVMITASLENVASPTLLSSPREPIGYLH